MPATSATIRVRGVTYRDPDEARVAAEEIEHHAGVLADEHRADGDEAQAEAIVDRAAVDARRLRTWARDTEAEEAAELDEPDEVRDEEPAPSKRPPAERRSRRKPGSPQTPRPKGRARRRGRRSAGGAGLLRSSRRDVKRFGRATELEKPIGGAADLFMLTIGATLGLVILKFFVGTSRGPATVENLSAGSAHFLSRLLSPTDPLFFAGGGADTSLSSIAARAGAGSPASSVLGTVGSVVGGGTGRVGGTGKLGAPAGRRVALPADVARPGVVVDARYAGLVTTIARRFGVLASSGYRSPAHNKAVGGAEGSDHVGGVAVDFVAGKSGQAGLSRLYTWALGQRFPYVEPMAQAKDHVHISFFSLVKRALGGSK